jgi:hypothetical protein
VEPRVRGEIIKNLKAVRAFAEAKALAAAAAAGGEEEEEEAAEDGEASGCDSPDGLEPAKAV